MISLILSHHESGLTQHEVRLAGERALEALGRGPRGHALAHRVRPAGRPARRFRAFADSGWLASTFPAPRAAFRMSSPDIFDALAARCAQASCQLPASLASSKYSPSAFSTVFFFRPAAARNSSVPGTTSFFASSAFALRGRTSAAAASAARRPTAAGGRRPNGASAGRAARAPAGAARARRALRRKRAVDGSALLRILAGGYVRDVQAVVDAF